MKGSAAGRRRRCNTAGRRCGGNSREWATATGTSKSAGLGLLAGLMFFQSLLPHHQRFQRRDSGCGWWELVAPVVGVPGGWFHIQNAGSRYLLSHVYRNNSPVFAPPPTAPSPSQYYEDWLFQWALYNPGFWCPTFPARNSRALENRCKTRIRPEAGSDVS